MNLENPYSSDFQQSQSKKEAKTLPLMSVFFTLFWWLGYMSDETCRGLVTINLSTVFVYSMEVVSPSIGNSLKAMHLGFMPILTLFLIPKYAVLTVCLNFFSLGIGFSEVKLSKMPHLLAANALGWVLCYIFLPMDGYEGAQQVREIYGDSSKVTQIIVYYMVCYSVLLGLGRKESIEQKILAKHRETLVSLNKELEVTNAKLKDTNRQLEDALQEKENFILRFSHEIRNPLNSLLGNVELCYECTEEINLKSMLTDAKVSGEILLQLLNNVLDTAKVSAGRLEISTHSHRIRSYLEKAWIICSEIIHTKGLYGSLSVNIDVPDFLEFDRHRMMQILINTVSNATKFTEQGHVKLYLDFIIGNEIKAEHMKPRHALALQSPPKSEEHIQELFINEKSNEDPQYKYEILTASSKKFSTELTRESYCNSARLIDRKIEIPTVEISPSMRSRILRRTQDREKRSNQEESATTTEGYIRLEIVDSGCGIKAEDLKSLFEKFKQVDVNTSKRQIGTGLGLWITREIIELMEGKAEIYSKPNQGTVLVIMLKSKSSSPSSSGEAVYSSPAALDRVSFSSERTIISRKKRVLLVEDLPYNQEVVKRILQKCEVQDITSAYNGLQAVEIFKEKGEERYFDLVLMDIDMPVMDGKAATKIIRAFEKAQGWAPTNLVFLSAYAESKTQKELLDKNGEYRANNFIPKPISLDDMKRILPVDSQAPQRLTMNSEHSLVSASQMKIMRMSNSKHRTILLVDDDPFNLTLLSKMLDMYSFKVIQARNGKIALDQYEKNWEQIDLVLMDCEMPVMDGLEATKLILAKHKQKSVLSKKTELKIYGVTGNIRPEYREKCLKWGMSEVLLKPLNSEDLRKVLENPSIEISTKSYSKPAPF